MYPNRSISLVPNHDSHLPSKNVASYIASKNMKTKPLYRAQWADLNFILAIALGAVLRFNPTSLAGFPINQGGMFAVMIDDLKANHFVLPAYTSFNHLNIPFAYPPFGFYIGELVSRIFSISSVQVVRWLPALFSSFSILAFYFLARQLLQSKYHASVATLFFALMPRALSWYITGSGLTRSPGQFFLLLTLASVVRLYKENGRRDILLAGIFAGLTILSHPEAAIHMITSVVFLWAILAHSRRSFLQTTVIGIIAFVVTSPWWLAVIHYHGIGPLLNAAQTGEKRTAILNLLFFNFTQEPYATLLAILGLIGIVTSLSRRDYLLPLWLAIPFLVEGRSAVLPAAIPLSMLAARGFLDGVLSRQFSEPENRTLQEGRVTAIEAAALMYIAFYLTFSTYQFGAQLINTSLSAADREAMSWVRTNTPEDSRFLVLTGTNAISCDSVLEWFPALTDRQSLYTVQGTEWTKGADFVPYVRSTYAMQQCLSAGDVSCLDSVVSRSRYDYLYVSKIPRLNCAVVNLPHAFSTFINSIKSDNDFDVVYESPSVMILRK
jgi:hypothetical protein